MVDNQQQPAAPRTPATSDLLAGRYVLEEQIAVGGMAVVWRAHDEVLARTVAVKILHGDLARVDSIRERFRREAIAAAKLVHPAIVSLFDTGVDGDIVYLVIEYIQGETLADVISDGPLDIPLAAKVGVHVTQALEHAHRRGIIHRDIKPANVLLAANGAVKVTDFGIAKAAGDPTITATGRVMGTAAYVAPEQLRGDEIDGAADLYSLGLLLYEALTGRQAFAGTDPIAVAEARLSAQALQPRDQRSDIPRDLDDLVAQLTAPDRADRLDDTVEIIERLRRYAAMEDQPAPLVMPGEEEAYEGSISSEMRWLAPVGGLLLLAAALVVVGIFGGVIERDSVASLFAEEVTPSPVPVAADDDPEGTDGEVTDQATEAVPLTDLTAFDPQGDRSERDRFLANLTDGAPNTVWATERYNSASFGNLKDGVGFTGDLGGARTLAGVTLVVPEGGFDVQIRVAGRQSSDLSAWPVVAELNGIDAGETRIDLPDLPQARYLMVWITGSLHPFEDQFRAEIGEVRVQALAS